MNAFTGEESTCFYARAGYERFEEVLEVLMDMFLESRFAREDIEKEREVIKEEIAMYLDQPHQHVQELLNEIMWPDHPLGRPLTGTPRTLEGLNRKSLISYQQANYTSATAVITAAGHIRHAQVVKGVERYARRFAPGKRASFLPADGQQKTPAIKLFTKKTAQMQVALGFQVCSRHDERRYALRVLNTMLGDNMSSRLFQVLREDHGLAYSVHSSLSFLDDAGVLTVSIGLDTDKLVKAFELMMREMRRLTATTPGTKELRQARDYLIGQLDLTLESTENHMMWLGDHVLGYGKVLSPSEIKKGVAQVTAGQVRQIAREFLRAERASLAMVSELKSSKGLARLITV
jgi:predicted Zn-dependent peptidase